MVVQALAGQRFGIGLRLGGAPIDGARGVVAVPQHQRERVGHLVLGLRVDDGEGGVAFLVGRDVEEGGDDGGLFEPRADEEEDGEDEEDICEAVIQEVS